MVTKIPHVAKTLKVIPHLFDGMIDHHRNKERTMSIHLQEEARQFLQFQLLSPKNLLDPTEIEEEIESCQVDVFESIGST